MRRHTHALLLFSTRLFALRFYGSCSVVFRYAECTRVDNDCRHCFGKLLPLHTPKPFSLSIYMHVLVIRQTIVAHLINISHFLFCDTHQNQVVVVPFTFFLEFVFSYTTSSIAAENLYAASSDDRKRGVANPSSNTASHSNGTFAILPSTPISSSRSSCEAGGEGSGVRDIKEIPSLSPRYHSSRRQAVAATCNPKSAPADRRALLRKQRTLFSATAMNLVDNVDAAFAGGLVLKIWRVEDICLFQQPFYSLSRLSLNIRSFY